MRKEVLAEGVELWVGDCLKVMPTLDAGSVDAVVTDPPYHLTPQNGASGEVGHPSWNGKNQADRAARKAGFMGKDWDGGDTAFQAATWAEAYRVLKPGGYLLAFGGSRTFHRIACAIEDAGFELRDTIMWIYGSGFPKSHNVAVSIDKQAGATKARGKAFNMKGRGSRADEMDANGREHLPAYAPATDAAREWEGWGTALKPAFEPIIVARKPLAKGNTVAANVLAYRTGAMNIDGCRVAHISEADRASATPQGRVTSSKYAGAAPDVDREGRVGIARPDTSLGRWPANLVTDGSDEVVGLFPQTTAPGGYPAQGARFGYNGGDRKQRGERFTFDAGGSAARFFYCAKASKKDRAGSKHPTVKPQSLMRWLCRLVTPPGGTVIDPFSGSGSTLQAARDEGFAAIGIEQSEEYCADIRKRFAEAELPEVADAPLQADMFTERPVPAKQEAMFR